MSSLSIPNSTIPSPLDSKFEALSISTLKDSPHVTVVALNRPRKRNAMNSTMWREIGQVFHMIGTLGDGCRCVLLMGNGKAFTAGLDVSDESFLEMQNLEDAKESKNGVDIVRRGMAFYPKIKAMQAALTAVEECPVPVIAAIHGSCIGGGIDLTCCADVRLCSPLTTFSIREVQLGLAADVGTLQRLPKIVGHGSRVRELCLTGEDFDAREAAYLGFVSRVSPSPERLLPMAIQVCQRIAQNSPVAVVNTKSSLNYSRDHSVADGLDHIATQNSLALMSDDLVNSFMATTTGEKPSFANLSPHSRL